MPTHAQAADNGIPRRAQRRIRRTMNGVNNVGLPIRRRRAGGADTGAGDGEMAVVMCGLEFVFYRLMTPVFCDEMEESNSR